MVQQLAAVESLTLPCLNFLAKRWVLRRAALHGREKHVLAWGMNVPFHNRGGVGKSERSELLGASAFYDIHVV